MRALFHGDVRNRAVATGAASLIQLASGLLAAEWTVAAGGDLHDMLSGVSAEGLPTACHQPDLVCVFPRPARTLIDCDAVALSLAFTALESNSVLIMTEDELRELLRYWRSRHTMPMMRDRQAFRIAAWRELHRITGETLALAQGEIINLQRENGVINLGVGEDA